MKTEITIIDTATIWNYEESFGSFTLTIPSNSRIAVTASDKPRIKSIKGDLQLLNFAYKRLLNKPYENEVTLTGQNPPLKCYQPLELFTQLKRGLDF